MMKSVMRKLARAMSKSDVSKLRHYERFTSEVSSPTNVKSPEVPKNKGLNSLSVMDLRYISGVRTSVRSRRTTNLIHWI